MGLDSYLDIEEGVVVMFDAAHMGQDGVVVEALRTCRVAIESVR
jgi:hypothetical protein